MSDDTTNNSNNPAAGQQPSAPPTAPTQPGAAPQAGSDSKGSPEGGEWIDLCPLGEVPPDGGTYVGLKTHSLAVFRLDDQSFQVMDDSCPHAGGSLAAGYVASGKVYCPWHGWPFNLADGACSDNDCIKVKTYPNRVVDGKIQAKL